MILYKKGLLAQAMQVLGIEELYPWQTPVFQSIMNFDDVLYIAPTGQGKSVLFQLPAVMEAGKHLTIVISPMLALQYDQVRKLQRKGVAACALNSDLTPAARREMLEALPHTMLLYLAPEQLLRKDLREALRHCDVTRVVVDEAHILVQTRDRFRPSYGKVGEFICALPNRPQIIACTATATKRECQEIQQALGMHCCTCYRNSVYRDNLRLTVREVLRRDGMPAAVLDELRDWNQKGLALVFCQTVQNVQQLTKYLNDHGWMACGYYAGMPKKEKDACVCDYAAGKYSVMVATSAFGLGVDIPNIRLVIHAGLPLGMSEYTQQIGRGGRNGKKTHCILLYAPGDKESALRILKGASGESVFFPRKYEVGALVKAIQSPDCLWSSISKYYGERAEISCGHCTQCQRKKYIA